MKNNGDDKDGGGDSSSMEVGQMLSDLVNTAVVKAMNEA
jgi:hypothetical protein